MELGKQNPPMTEDFLLFIMSLVARRRGSRVFFKISHNISLDRGWNFWCAPDMDLIEIRNDNTIVAYEVKGQRKRKNGYDWPACHDGLDQALKYLIMPRVTNQAIVLPMFNRGVPDLVYLVHPVPFLDSLDPLDLKVISLTPVGFIGILPLSTDRINKRGNLDPSEAFASELDKVVEVTPAQKNPLQDTQAKAFLLENAASLRNFGEIGKTFGRRVKQAALDYLGAH